MLHEAWINRLFSHFEALYGSKFANLWQGTDIANVKRMWAEKLAGFEDKPKAIKFALDALDDHPYPPTLPEFLILCRTAAKRIGNDKPMLEHKFTEDEMQRNRERLAQMIAGLCKEKVTP